MDFRLTDPWLDPPGDGENAYSEESIRLAHSFWCYDPRSISETADLEFPVAPSPAATNGAVTFGYLGAFCKVTERMLGLWASIFRSLPESRLLLLVPAGSSQVRVARFFADAGISPSRVTMTDERPLREYLKLYEQIDLFLDTIPYNGHTTSLDALWMGVPVVTLLGNTVVGRAGFSHLNNLGLTDMFAKSEDDYARVARELAEDIPKLVEIRRNLRLRMQHSPLMDARGWTRSVEAAYREMWRKWCDRRDRRQKPPR
jgi:predicted O-linked N-acetylglucosamine transferase (SPINDLY family)